MTLISQPIVITKTICFSKNPFSKKSQFFFNLLNIDVQHDITNVFISIQIVKQIYMNCILWWYLKFTEYKFVSNSKDTFAMIISTSNRENMQLWNGLEKEL